MRDREEIEQWIEAQKSEDGLREMGRFFARLQHKAEDEAELWKLARSAVAKKINTL